MPKVVPEYKEEAKRRIIAAGFAVMSKKGYCTMTMDDIALHIGVSKGALYQYFKKKEDLVLEIIKTMDEDVTQTVMTIFPNRTPMEIWSEVLDRYMNKDIADNSIFMEVLAMTARNDSIKESLSQMIRLWIDMATQTIADQQSGGLIRKDVNPRILAFALISGSIGLRNLAMLGIDQEEIRECWTTTGKLLLGIPDSPKEKDPVIEKS